MKAIRRVLKWLFLGWGAVSLALVVLFAGYVAYKASIGNQDKVDRVSPEEAASILRDCGLEGKKVTRVLNSYISGRSMTGDHLDAIAFEVSELDVPESLGIREGSDVAWHRGDRLPEVMQALMDFNSMWIYHSEISWFPSKEELLTDRYYMCPDSIYFYGARILSGSTIFIRPADNMVFYLSAQM